MFSRRSSLFLSVVWMITFMIELCMSWSLEASISSVMKSPGRGAEELEGSDGITIGSGSSGGSLISRDGKVVRGSSPRSLGLLRLSLFTSL
jgi:hypothetical protein